MSKAIVKMDMSFVGISDETTVFERMSVGILGQDYITERLAKTRNRTQFTQRLKC
jgi:hypothetical protein